MRIWGKEKSANTACTTQQSNQIFTSFYANFPTRCKLFFLLLFMLFFTCDTAGRKDATEARLPEKDTYSTQSGEKQPKYRILLLISLIVLQPYPLHLLLLLRLPSDLINMLALILKIASTLRQYYQLFLLQVLNSPRLFAQTFPAHLC